MKIGVLTPSVYMYQTRYRERIFAPGELVRNLVTGLVARDHDVTWFSAPKEDTKAHLVAGDNELLEKDLQIRVFQDLTPEIKEKMSLYGTKMYYEMDLCTRAYTTAVKETLDLVHVFHSFGYLAHYFADLTGIPTLFTMHDPIPTDDMLERWLFDRFPQPRYISISRAQQGSFASHFFGNVYNGIDTNEFTFSAQPGDHCIAVGRMVRVKGFDHAITAVKATGGKLTIASWINENIKKSVYYREKIAPFVDGETIRVESMLAEGERVRMYREAKALIFPIQWEEPFGLVMVEAMACGTPVIAYNRGSVNEVVVDGVTGFIIDPDDQGRPGKGKWIIKKQGVEGLIEAIGKIGQIDRSACRKHVLEHFTIDKMVEGYEKIYQSVLANR